MWQLWNEGDKITKKFHTFSVNVCYTSIVKREVCTCLCGKGVPNEQYLIFSDTKSNVRVSL